ncbi:MAG TPA: hypothetical protein VIU63_10755 [Nitrospira sp.]
MSHLVRVVGLLLVVSAGAAHADPCDDLRALALMPTATVATHAGNADPDWFDDSERLSDLTLNAAPCTIGLNPGGGVAHVDCHLVLNDAAAVDPFFDAVDQCLKDTATKLSRDPGQKDYIWTAAGTMVKIWVNAGTGINVRIVY